MKRPLRPSDPTRLGSYRLLGRLGEGGMGTVYLAQDEGGRLVAVKVVRPEYAYEPEFRARFRSEVNRARQVPPFCTAAVLDADPDHATPYLVVEYVDGPSLAEVVADQGPLHGGNLHSVAIGVSTALAAIHGAGVIHRDLKPGNVLFSLGTPKVIDFGIARALEATSQHTRTEQMVGTVAYMAPERFDTANRSVGQAADVFAWGAVVTYAGTGRTPFAADSAAATAASILTQPPELTGLSGLLRDLVALTLAKDPDARPTAHELLTMLLAAEANGAPALAVELERRPELRRAAESAQHSSRYVTGDPASPGFSGSRRLAGTARRPRARMWIGAVGAAALITVPAATQVLTAADDAPPPTPAGVAASATPGAAAMPAPRAVRGPSVIDRLDRPGQWREVDESGGRCAFDEALVVTTGLNSTFRCSGPTDHFAGDQSIAADVTLGTAGSCAQISFRSNGPSGYTLSICPDGFTVQLEDGDSVTTLRSAPSTLFAAGARHRVRIGIAGDVAAVTVDGAAVTEVPVTQPALAAGRVSFGVTTFGSSDSARASFANAEIRSL